MKKKQYTIKNKTVSSRSAVLFFIFILIFTIIISKLGYLQLYSNNKYKIEEYKDSLSYLTLEAKRGDIYDRSGNILAKSISVNNGYFSTSDYNTYKKTVGEAKDNETKKLEKIFELLQLNKDEIFSKAEEYNNLLIKKELTEEDKSLIKSKNSFLISVSDNNAYFSVLEYDKFKIYTEKSKQAEEDKLQEIFEQLEIDMKKVFDRADRGTNFRIKKSIAPEIAKEIRELESSIISVEIEQSRNYVDGKFAPYVIGHSNENGGQTGVENYFDNILSGTSGAKRIIKENLNKSVVDVVDAKNGEDIYLTIDSTIQEFVSKYGQEYFEKEKPNKLSVIVSDVNNGDILAMENFPKYDLNNPTEARTAEEEKEISELGEKERLDKIFTMWRNASVSDLYEPGSVFKLITASAALEENTDTLDSTFYCNGFIRDIPGITIRCFNWREPHGTQTFTKAMDNSCNPAFVQMARKLGRDRLYRYVKGFGFGSTTGINLPGESKGLVPSKVEEIGSAELATMSYGHGVSTTPLQMMFASNAIVNGGYLLEPQISIKNVKKLQDGTLEINENTPKVKNQIISKDTSDKMRVIMEHGVDEGIVSRVSSNVVRVGAKSGTTIKNINNEYDENKIIASVYAVFPIENPKYSIMIVFDEPKTSGTGSTASGPLAKKLIDDIANYKQLTSDFNGKNSVVRNTNVPNVEGMTLEYASEILEEKFLNYRVKANSTQKGIVTSQSEPSGKSIAEGTVIELTLSEDVSEKIVVVDFTDMSYQKAMDVVSKMGYKYRTSGGKGKFKSVNKEVKSFISKDEEIVLTFEE